MANQDFLDYHEAALDEANAFVGESFTFRGASYTGIINEVEITTALQDGGFLEGLAKVIIIPKTVLATIPAVGEKLTTNGKTLRIDKVKEDESSFEVTLITAAK
jgi:hypothetical protein